MLRPWAAQAETMVSNGFSPIPLLPCTKRPRFPNWQRACYADPNSAFIARHAAKYATDGVGLACGRMRNGNEEIGWLLAIDCDADDPAVSAEIARAVLSHLGETPLMRLGRPNRWARMYRQSKPVRSVRGPSFEILGAGHQIVAFGEHPATRQPYVWVDESPVSILAQHVPLVGPTEFRDLLSSLGSARDDPRVTTAPQDSYEAKASIPTWGVGKLRWTMDEHGFVIDGRDAFLTWCVAKSDGDPDAAWQLFSAYADLSRKKRSTNRHWGFEDARDKATRLECRKRAGKLSGFRGGKHVHPQTGWSGPEIAELKKQGFQLHHDRQLSLGELKVHDAMADLLKGNGTCFASIETLANSAKVSRSCVAKARSRLRALGIWLTPGINGKTAVYVPRERMRAPES